MAGKNITDSDYFRLFVKREGKVVFGRYMSNLWLLVIVLVITFLAIGFSNASLTYLSDKMNDPFTNWVNIENDFSTRGFSGLEKALDDDALKARFHYKDYQSDYKDGFEFFGREEGMAQYLKSRFFERINTDLVDAILSEDNLVGDHHTPAENLSDESIGVIVTKEAMDRLGYGDDFPAYLNVYATSSGAEQYGIEVTADGYAAVPLPVLAVVKKLPMNMDLIAARYLYEQKLNDLTWPLNLDNESYARSLYYFVPEGTVDFDTRLTEAVASVSEEPFKIYPVDMPQLRSCKPGTIRMVSFESEESVSTECFVAAAEAAAKALAGSGAVRLYNYDLSDYQLPDKSFISVNFSDLDSIRPFERFVKQEYKVKIEMTQINAKENFNAVSITANILSWAMIVFAIVCIVLFIVNLLRSYFQKVKRNIGTFKAFGVSNSSLISVYSIIVLAMVIVAVAIAFVISLAIQEILPLAGVLKEGTYRIIMLGSAKMLSAVIVIILSSVLTVYVVMTKLLRSTPGDLLYDRQ